MLIEIEQDEYDQMQRDHLMFRALQIEGVENWALYDQAVETYRALLEVLGLET